MKTKFLFLMIAFMMQSYIAKAQEFQKPSDGKAVIYLLRTSNLGGAINFKFFIDQDYIGKFSGKNFARYELDAGKHLIWSKSENLDFMEADLKADAIYLIQVKPKMGGLKAAVRLEVLDTEDVKLFGKVQKMLAKKKAVQLNMKKSEKVTPKIKGYLEKYEKLKNGDGKDKIKILSSNMNYTS